MAAAEARRQPLLSGSLSPRRPFISFSTCTNEMSLTKGNECTRGAVHITRGPSLGFEARGRRVAYRPAIEIHQTSVSWPWYKPRRKNKHEGWIIQPEYENPKWIPASLIDSVAVRKVLRKDAEQADTLRGPVGETRQQLMVRTSATNHVNVNPPFLMSYLIPPFLWRLWGQGESEGFVKKRQGSFSENESESLQQRTH